MEKAYVFLDGAYLSEISKYFGGGKHIRYDLNQFAITLAKSEDLWCQKVFYYTAPPFQCPIPTPEEKQKRANYDKFIKKLEKIPGFVIREGRCQKINESFHQKGVDTLITMDLLNILSEKKIKTMVLLACDTDFVPILNELRKNGIRVILYYFSDRVRKSKFSMSNHLFTACDKKTLLTKAHFENSQFPSKLT
ncbi:MAG: NYN domain-containing protein [archaeon]